MMESDSDNEVSYTRRMLHSIIITILIMIKALVTLGIRLTYDVHTIDFSAKLSNVATI